MAVKIKTWELHYGELSRFSRLHEVQLLPIGLVQLRLLELVEQWLGKGLQNVRKFVKNSVLRVVEPRIIKDKLNVIPELLPLCVLFPFDLLFDFL